MMSHPSHLHIDKTVLLVSAAFAVVLLFIISPDSYTHDLYGRHDSAWFFMCGKAWMEGLTPYVDFADSKGPLLWLIYGLGYLISPTNYIGVFWLNCVWYALIFYITYLTARFFLPGRRNALICTLLMALAYFNPMFHYETRAEDWCMLFMIASLYLTSKMLYGDEQSKKGIHLSFFLLGVCFAALVLIKYNIAAMQSVFILFAGYHAIRRHHSFVLPFLWLLAGLLITFTPFILYLIAQGSFHAFIQEYFVNAYITAFFDEGLREDYLYDWVAVLTNPLRLPFFLILVVGGILFSFKTEKYKLFPLISTLFIFAITVTHSYWDYYFNSCAICCIWPIIWLTKVAPTISTRPVITAMGVVVALTVCQLAIDRYFKHNLFWNDGQEREEFYNYEYYISQIPQPTIINASFHEEGHGILSRALPGTKYWAKQNGSSVQMNMEHINGILSRKASFIIMYQKADNLIEEDFIHHAGYPYHYAGYLLSKKQLSKPAKPIHVSNWEVFTKQMPEALRR